MREKIDFAALTRDLRYALSDPCELVKKLNLATGAKLKPNRASIRCPNHDDHKPSCSVTTGKDGTVRVKCFSCQFSADAIGLVARVNGLQTKGPDFILVLAECAKLAGMFDTQQALLKGRELPKRTVTPPKPKPDKPYPPANEIKWLWGNATPAADDAECSAYLVKRRIEPQLAPARAIPKSIKTPKWAQFWGDLDKPKTWIETGHRLIVPTFDAVGVWRSVRAICVAPTEVDMPKRLPPTSFKAQGLVLANKQAVLMLRGQLNPEKVVIVEGEPDWLTWSSRRPPDKESPYAVIGVISGAWSQQISDRFPDGCNVILRTHGDQAGDRYATQVAETIKGRCKLWRAA
jgi:hypothetical protein